MCMGLTDGRQASELARIRRRAESAILVSDKPNEAELTWQGQAQNPTFPPIQREPDGGMDQPIHPSANMNTLDGTAGQGLKACTVCFKAKIKCETVAGQARCKRQVLSLQHLHREVSL